MSRIVFALLVALVAAVPAPAQTLPPRDGASSVVGSGTAVLAGVVTTNGVDARPLRRALVSLAGTSGNAQAVTDDAGRFAFPSLRAGRYTITAEKPGYVKQFYGSRAVARGPSTAIALADGQRLTTLAIRLVRGGVIAGTVLDENGSPISSAGVSALMASRTGGDRKLVVPPGRVDQATTDDRGMFRIYGLPPGEYTVRAAAGLAGGPGGVRQTSAADVEAALRDLQAKQTAGRTGGALTAAVASPVAVPEVPTVMRTGTYFPAATDAAEAETFVLGAGEERTGVDVRVSLVRAARIAGIAVDPGGRPLQNVLVGIANASTGSLWSSPGIVDPGPDGRFSMASMPPGRFVLFGRGGEGTSRMPPWPLWTETEVVVNGIDLSGVVLQFHPGSTVSGRFMFRGAPSIPVLTNARVVLTPLPTIPGASVGSSGLSMQADGTFVLKDVAPGKYRLAVTGITGWSLRSAVVEGRDTLDTPLEIRGGQDVADLVVTMTDQPATISGTLFDQLGRPTPEYAVVVFSTDRAHWAGAPRRMSGLVKLGSDGTFSVVGLPPGEYFLVAVTDASPDQLNDPAFLELLAPGGLRVTLGEGERKTQDIKLGG